MRLGRLQEFWAVWCCFALGASACAAVEFPGTSPGEARAVVQNGTWTLSNSMLSATWSAQGGVLRPVSLLNKLTGQSTLQTNCEVFRISYQPQVWSNNVRLMTIKLETNRIDALVSVDGIKWVVLASYPREEFSGPPDSVQLGKMDPNGGDTDYSVPGPVGQCRFDNFSIQDELGQALFVDDFSAWSPSWTVLQSTEPQTQVTVTNGVLLITAPGNCHAFIRGPVPAEAAIFTCTIDKFTDAAWSWGPALCVRWASGRFLLVGYRQGWRDVFNVTSSLGGEQIVQYLPLKYEIAASDFQLVSGPEIRRSETNAPNGRLGDKIPGYELVAHLRHAGTGTEVDWRTVLRDQANYVRQFITVSCTTGTPTLTAVEPLDCGGDGPLQLGGVQGSPVVGNQWFCATEAPFGSNIICSNEVRSGFACSLPLNGTNQYEFSSVIGFFPVGQLRRGFLYYLERERAMPYHPLLHYNSWCNAYDNVSESNFLAAIDLCHQELGLKRGLRLDSFALDDGWDDPAAGFWQVDTNKFPDTFQSVRNRAGQAGARLGIWISPLGGYEPRATARTQRAREAGIIPPTASLDLSYPSYYDWLLNECRGFVQDYQVDYFKWDCASFGVTDPHTMALARLADELHRGCSNVYLNMTVGSWPSPFWLQHVDCTWRGGTDTGYRGVGTLLEQMTTYRDAQTYLGVVEMSKLYPLNSIMLHGIVCTDDSAGEDLQHNIRSFFGTGTSLQELYLRPSLMSSNAWDYLAEAARWAQENPDVLVDTHWVGGDPSQLNAYGWASWTPRKGILILRNPSDQASAIVIDAATVFELPVDAARTYALSTPYPDQRLPVDTLTAGQPVSVNLLPFEVLVLEASPRTTYAEWVQQNFPLNADPIITADSADPDNDGVPNLLEYAFHTDPLSPDSSSALRIAVQDGAATLSFPWNLTANDIQYTIETSTNLISWQSAHLSETSTYTANGTLQITAITPLSNERQRFYRLRVTRL